MKREQEATRGTGASNRFPLFPGKGGRQALGLIIEGSSHSLSEEVLWCKQEEGREEEVSGSNTDLSVAMVGLGAERTRDNGPARAKEKGFAGKRRPGFGEAPLQSDR